MRIRTVLVVAMLWGSAWVAGAQAIDGGLKAQLDQAGLKYQVTKSGNVTVTFTEEDDRTQVVYLRGKTDSLDGLALREIWSSAGILDENPDAQDLIDLLTEGGSESLGAWNLEKADDGWLLYYSAKLPTAMEGVDLRSALEAIAEVADRKESDWFDSDDN